MCPHCKSSNIKLGAELSMVGDVGGIGLLYEVENTMLYKTKIEQLAIDFCIDCGTVVRFFVKEPKRKWIKK